jgi:phosphatidylcholine synthase
VSTPAAGPLRRMAAWGVHLLTASSAPAGLLAVLAIWRGDAATAFGWMAYALAVDSIDGTLARAVGVKQVVPTFDGTKLDDIVDYFSYAIVPALFLVHMDIVPPASAVPLAAGIVLASAYGFSQTAAKTADHYFTGFPSYWNILVFYLYALGWPRALNAAIVVLLTIGVFVPLRYIYPSRMHVLRGFTVGFGMVWGVTVLYMLAHLEGTPRALLIGSLLFPAYYVGLSIVLHLRGIARASNLPAAR